MLTVNVNSPTDIKRLGVFLLVTNIILFKCSLCKMDNEAFEKSVPKSSLEVMPILLR